MEGDAGASRLNPIDADQTASAADDSSESEAVADETAPEATEPARADESPESEVETHVPAVERRPSRLGRGWLAAIAAALLVAAGGIGVGGYFALRSHHESQAIARDNAEALKAAVTCVEATQAPDVSAMAQAEQKIIDCGTEAFRSQALLYTGVIVEAYQAANAHVQVSDARAAVEHHNNDGSVDVLVALRVKLASDQTQSETGYRLRVKMARAEGQYRIAKLDQVTK